jgi:hypothetical protein
LIQYSHAVIEAALEPRPARTQTYGPPSAVQVEPSSAVMSPYGMKNRTIRIVHQVNQANPIEAAEAIPSMVRRRSGE